MVLFTFGEWRRHRQAATQAATVIRPLAGLGKSAKLPRLGLSVSRAGHASSNGPGSSGMNHVACSARAAGTLTSHTMPGMDVDGDYISGPPCWPNCVGCILNSNGTGCQRSDIVPARHAGHKLGDPASPRLHYYKVCHNISCAIAPAAPVA